MDEFFYVINVKKIRNSIIVFDNLLGLIKVVLNTCKSHLGRRFASRVFYNLLNVEVFGRICSLIGLISIRVNLLSLKPIYFYVRRLWSWINLVLWILNRLSILKLGPPLHVPSWSILIRARINVKWVTDCARISITKTKLWLNNGTLNHIICKQCLWLVLITPAILIQSILCWRW